MPARSARLSLAQLVPPDNSLWLKGLNPSFSSMTSERINVAQKRLYKRCWCGYCSVRPAVSARSRGPPRGVLSVLIHVFFELPRDVWVKFTSFYRKSWFFSSWFFWSFPHLSWWCQLFWTAELYHKSAHFRTDDFDGLNLTTIVSDAAENRCFLHVKPYKPSRRLVKYRRKETYWTRVLQMDP